MNIWSKYSHLQVWFKNRRAKCRQQVKQNQQQHHNGTGSDKTTASRNPTGNSGSKSSGKSSGGGNNNATVNNNNKMSPTINGNASGGVTSSTAGNSPVSTGTSLSSSRQSPPGGVTSYIKPILSGTPPIQPPPAVYHPSSGKTIKQLPGQWYYCYPCNCLTTIRQTYSYYYLITVADNHIPTIIKWITN